MLILSLTDDLDIPSGGHLAKLPLLVCSGLVEGRDSEIDCDALRGFDRAEKACWIKAG